MGAAYMTPPYVGQPADEMGKVDGLYLDDRLPEPASAIRVARLYDIPQILPAAYHALYCIPHIDADWRKYREQGPIRAGSHLICSGRTARWDEADTTDFTRLIRLQEHFRRLEREAKIELDGEFIPSEHCTRPAACKDVYPLLVSHLFLDSRLGNNILEQIRKRTLEMCPDMCTYCRPRITLVMDNMGGKIWTSISQGLKI